MSGIVGYISKNNNPESLRIGLNALKKLEYKGYDSVGFAIWDNKAKNIFCQKTAGKISELERKINKDSHFDGPMISHIRWATHGEVTDYNAHPHSDCKKDIWLVHNGIIENYQELKKLLIKEGHKFISQTDTEVVPHLIEKFLKKDLEDAVKQTLKYLKGSYALLVMARNNPNKIVAACSFSPLLLGLNENECLISSDSSAIIPHTKRAIFLNNEEVVTISSNNFSILKKRKSEIIKWNLEEAQKKNFPHFMLKEIMEEPEAIKNAIQGRLILEDGKVKLGGLSQVEERLKKTNKIILVGCGTAFYAAGVGKYMIEECADIPTEVDIGSEFRYRKLIVDEKTTAIFISQSGETADTLAALREMNRKNILTLGITNVEDSSQAKETTAGIYTKSGPEIAIASTKVFLGQLSVLAMLAVYLGRQKGRSLVMEKKIISELINLPKLAEQVLKQSLEIKKLAKKYKDYKNFWFIGRKYNAPIALEGALKLKEVSYLHAEGLSGGELKHGPLALIDKNFPTIAICPKDSVYEKMISNIQEIKARKGKVLAITTKGNRDIENIVDDVIYIPQTLEILTPLLSVIPLHLFAYHIAVLLGYDVDKPRNLIKSVSVE